MRETEYRGEFQEAYQITDVAEFNAIRLWEKKKEAEEKGSDPNAVTLQEIGEIHGIDSEEGVFAIKNHAGEYAASGSIQIFPGKKPTERAGILSGVYTAPEHRGKGLAKEITKRREEWARQLGLEKVRTTIFTNNISSLKSKLHDGYAIVSISPRGNSFTVEKKLVQSEPPEYSETERVLVLDAQKITDMTKQGWVGLDIEEDAGKTFILLAK